ncbi:hypothetical protein Tco_1397112, partial [Tanacetum coccineum]
VMAAPIISISSDSSKKSVSSHAPRVILFGAIPAIIPVIPEVPIVPVDPIVSPEEGTVSVVSPTEVLDLVDYSSSFDSDPSEDSLPPVPDLPLVLPFGSSSHDTLAPLSKEDIPIGRLYRTYYGGPCRALTARKSVRPLSSHRLALRYTSHHLDHFSSKSSSHSSSDHSSSGHSILGPSLSGHTPPDTTDADLSTPQRFVHRSLARTPRRSEAFRRWRSTPSYIPYPPTTSESSLGSSPERSLDSSTPSSGPSRKRCRSPAASVPSPTHDLRSIASTLADLLLPRNRFRDSYSPEDSGEEHIEVDTADAEAVADEDDEEFKAKASTAKTREIAIDPLAIGDCSESSRGGIPGLEDTIYDIVYYMSEVCIYRITEIKTTQRQLEACYWYLVEKELEEFRQVRRDRDDTWRRLRRLESYNMTITCSGMTPEAIKELINRQVEEALVAYEATHAANAIEAENQSQNGSNGDNGNGENGNGRNGNPNENGRGDRPVARECTYQDFMKCQPLNFKGTEEVAGLIRWFEKMETVFYISNCPEKYQVKYATCTLLKSALTWWNSHKRTIGAEAAFSMSWRESS